MASKHLDLLVRQFISGSSNPGENFDPFKDLQDPTFLSFKLDFFPDAGLSMPLDSYSSGGLLRPSNDYAKDTYFSYTFYDSAATYLARIGAPARQASLNQFIKLLKKVQDQAPWYFQSVAGLGELYKIDKNINYRGKDKIITVECLESVDMRMSMLSDLYRTVAFDMENWREVLPINLRTFNMVVHVLEMRKFNTTFGIIADTLDPTRSVQREANQKAILDSSISNRNVYNKGTALFAGTFDNVRSAAYDLNTSLGGMFTYMGDQAGLDRDALVKSAFEAISVQSFYLRDCEFDFFSEAPPYLDNVSVKDATEASFRFKINVGRIEKIGFYPFDKFVISEWAKNTRIDPNSTTNELSGRENYSNAYFEANDLKGINTNAFNSLRQSIYPDFRTQVDAYTEQKKESDNLRRRPLESALGSLANMVTPMINQTINQELGDLTSGVLGTPPMGNVYGDENFYYEARTALIDFLTPGQQKTGGQKSYQPSPETLPKNILDPLTNPEFKKENVYKGDRSANPRKQSLDNTNVF